MTKWNVVACFLVVGALPAFAKEDLRPSTVQAMLNAANVVLLCPTKSSVVKGYDLAFRGKSFLSTGCSKIPDGATVMVDCSASNRDIATIWFGGRRGLTSAEQLDESCAPR